MGRYVISVSLQIPPGGQHDGGDPISLATVHQKMPESRRGAVDCYNGLKRLVGRHRLHAERILAHHYRRVRCGTSSEWNVVVILKWGDELPERSNALGLVIQALLLVVCQVAPFEQIFHLAIGDELIHATNSRYAGIAVE